MNLSVITYTIRSGGLEWMIKYLAHQTFQDFEWIVVDAFHEQRKEVLGDLSKDLGVHLIHLPEPDPGYKYLHYNIASNGNEALKHVTTPNIVIIDDWHVFPQNLLEEQMKYLEMGYAACPRWHHVAMKEPTGDEYTNGYNEFVASLEVTEIDQRSSKDAPRAFAHTQSIIKGCPASWWWPNASSVPSEYMIEKAQGYDERLNGGTGGTDNDIAMRMQLCGLKFLYLLYMDVYHINTSGLAVRQIPGLCETGHDRSPFTYNQYHKGDPNLVENESLITTVEDGIKFFKCKHCGVHGVIDSQDVINSNMRNRRIVPPTEAVGLPRGNLLEDRKKMIADGYTHITKCSICGSNNA